MQNLKQNLIMRWRMAARLFVFLAIGCGLAGLCGWIFDSAILRTGFSGSANMQVNAALSLIVLGVSTLLLFYNRQPLARLGGVFVLILCLFTFSQYVLGINMAIDTLLLPESWLNVPEDVPVRMSVLTAISLSLLSLAVLAFTFEWFLAGQLLASFLFILVYASLIDSIYGIKGSALQASYVAIASHMALGLFLLSLALLLYFPTKGWIKLLSSQYAGGNLARLTFSYFLFVSPIFIGLYLYTINKWRLSPELGILSLFLLTCLITLPITFYYLQRLNTLDAHLQKAHFHLQATNNELQKRNEELSEALADLKQGNRELAVMSQEVIKSSLNLEQKNKELLRLNQGLELIVQMAGHDLKTPVFNLQILFQQIKPALETILSEEQSKVIGLMNDSIASLKITIEGLAQIIWSQQTIIGLQVKVSITKLMAELKKELARDMSTCEAEIILRPEVDTIIFSQIHLRSILFNLVSNALKYSSPLRRPTIEVKTKKAPGGVEIIISDNGLGMNEKQLTQLFTIFKRFHSHVEGSGVGLYIVKQTIENNGGSIKVESTEGVGTSFTIFIPQHDEKPRPVLQ